MSTDTSVTAGTHFALVCQSGLLHAGRAERRCTRVCFPLTPLIHHNCFSATLFFRCLVNSPHDSFPLVISRVLPGSKFDGGIELVVAAIVTEGDGEGRQPTAMRVPSTCLLWPTQLYVGYKTPAHRHSLRGKIGTFIPTGKHTIRRKARAIWSSSLAERSRSWAVAEEWLWICRMCVCVCVCVFAVVHTPVRAHGGRRMAVGPHGLTRAAVWVRVRVRIGIGLGLRIGLGLG